MKKLILTFFLSIFMFACSESDLDFVKDNFAVRYPKAENVTWSTVNGNYVASFTVNDIQEYAYYSGTSWVATESVLDFDMLKDDIQTHWSESEFSTWTIVEIIMTETSSNVTQYSIESVSDGGITNISIYNSDGEFLY